MVMVVAMGFGAEVSGVAVGCGVVEGCGVFLMGHVGSWW